MEGCFRRRHEFSGGDVEGLSFVEEGAVLFSTQCIVGVISTEPAFDDLLVGDHRVGVMALEPVIVEFVEEGWGEPLQFELRGGTSSR